MPTIPSINRGRHITARQAAGILGCTRQGVEHHRKAGHLKGHQIGVQWFYRLADVLELAGTPRRPGPKTS